MPAASSSRRPAVRTRRAPSDDNIEEGEPTQHNNVDLVMGDETEPSTHRSVKKETKDKKGKAVCTDAGLPEESDDDDGIIDIENFRDHPLDRKDGTKLHGIAQDWELIRKQIHHSSFSLVKDVSISLADVMEAGQSAQVRCMLSIAVLWPTLLPRHWMKWIRL